MKITISLAQIDVNLGAPDTNSKRVFNWVEKAASLNSDVILFPELWSTGYDLENWEHHAAYLGRGIFKDLSQMAKRYRIAIGGSILENYEGGAYNTFVLYDSDGDLVGKYRKIHLFRLMEEDRWLHSGNELAIANAIWGGTGLAICYDLRFPEMFRRYALVGTRVVFLVAEWPETRIDHWEVLLKARAIENQMFIAAVNRVGESKGEKFGGRSSIVDPWGKTVVSGDETEKMLTATIDLEESDKIRTRIPVFEDRRPEIYDSPVHLASEA